MLEKITFKENVWLKVVHDNEDDGIEGHESDGYPEDDPISHHKYCGDYYLRINRFGDTFNWVLMKNSRVVDEAFDRLYAEFWEAAKAVELAYERHKKESVVS